MSTAARTLARRALVAALVLGVLLAPWPGWRRAHGALFRWSANAGFAIAGADGVELRANAGATAPRFDTLLVRTEARGRWSYALDSLATGLLPFAVFVAVFVAAPGPPPRRARLSAGLALVAAYVVARVGIAYLAALTGHVAEGVCPDPHAALLARPSWRAAITTLARLDSDPAVYVLVPVLVWAGCSLAALTLPTRRAGA
jgi:hypothetical protein